MAKLLQVKGVSNSYVTRSLGSFGRRIEKPVLRDINIEMDFGEIFGIVGESGCGKTTLGRCVLGLIEYRGEILIDGRRQESRGRRVFESTAKRRAMAGLAQAVFQDPATSLNPTKRAGWLLEEPLRVNRLGSRAERLKRVDETLELVGLDPSYKNRRVNELSVGQKQRICIACALMLKPRLIVADEAVSALDVSVGAQILNLFRELNRTLGLGMVFISHNLNLVYYLCDRIAVMRKGRVVEQGNAEEVYGNPKDPYTKELLRAIPELPQAVPELPQAVPELPRVIPEPP
ncbi:MAG: ATP-binding cassette domain-containing protein [Treponema sp.]|jgi:ABC-type glutathione transport system ATPase component|nr:ATP-binding cassette domain-containing protein [Treponema sp.]